MNTSIATTQEQSARLLRCGVSADTADMYWDNHTIDEPFLVIGEVEDKRDILAWSLSALLGLIPHTIEMDDDTECYFCLAKDYLASEDYSAAYLECWSFEHESVARIRDKSPIEACVQLIEWLTENGYKLNEI